jgi:hypothetical protein
MSLRVAFLEGPARDGRWHVGSDVDDPELADMTIDEWIERVRANATDVDEATGHKVPAYALWARRLAPRARAFAIFGQHGVAVALVWESTG